MTQKAIYQDPVCIRMQSFTHLKGRWCFRTSEHNTTIYWIK